MKMQLLLLALVTTSILLILLPGCSGQNDALNNKEQPVTPESFSDAKSTWTKTKGMTEHDTDRLMKYFSLNPSVAEHSIISGDPAVYSSDNKSYRYYWVQNGMSGTEWMCLEFGSREGSLTSGQENPFGDDKKNTQNSNND